MGCVLSAPAPYPYPPSTRPSNNHNPHHPYPHHPLASKRRKENSRRYLESEKARSEAILSARRYRVVEEKKREFRRQYEERMREKEMERGRGRRRRRGEEGVVVVFELAA